MLEKRGEEEYTQRAASPKEPPPNMPTPDVHPLQDVHPAPQALSQERLRIQKGLVYGSFGASPPNHFL